MRQKGRAWLAAAGVIATAVAGLVSISGTTAGAEPTNPTVPVPTIAPLANNQVAPAAAPAAVSAPQPALVPATSGTMRDYFGTKNVTLQPQKAQDFKALDITLPMPTGWTQVPDPNVPDAFVVIADRGSPDLYVPNAQVVVYKLVGDFDPKEAITHGFVDSLALPAWQSTDANLNDFGGMPSSLIEGTYRSNDLTLNTSRRYVIAASGHDSYLVSLAVTTTVPRAIPDAPVIDGILSGFRVNPAG